MPTGGNTGEYYKLSQKYGSDVTDINSLQYNLSTPLSSFYYGSSPYNQGSNGLFWSSSFYNEYAMDALRVDPDRVSVGSLTRYYGFSMRCLVGS